MAQSAIIRRHTDLRDTNAIRLGPLMVCTPGNVPIGETRHGSRQAQSSSTKLLPQTANRDPADQGTPCHARPDGPPVCLFVAACSPPLEPSQVVGGESDHQLAELLCIGRQDSVRTYPLLEDMLLRSFLRTRTVGEQKYRALLITR
jgi:hypothetical protein